MCDHARAVWNDRYQTRQMTSPLDFTHKAYKYVQDIKPCSILDIGCGDGRDSIFFAQKGLDVTAIDFSEEAIHALRSKHSAIDAHVMDIEAMQFAEASFDAIYAHLSLHYFDDHTTRGIFTNIFRMLKGNGLLFVKCKSTTDPLYGKGKQVQPNIFIDEYQRHFFSQEYMTSMLENFVILELEETCYSYNKKKSCFIEAVARKPMST